MSDQKLLPEPVDSGHEVTASKWLGVQVRPFTPGQGRRSYALVKNGQRHMGVAIHRTSRLLESFAFEYMHAGRKRVDSMPGLFKVFTHLKDPGEGVTFLLQSHRVSYGSYNRHLSDLRQRVNPAYQEWLIAAQRWFNPQPGGVEFSNSLVYWAPWESMLPMTDVGVTAALDDSALLTYPSAGPTLRQVLLRQPITGASLRPDPESGVYDHHFFAAPRDVELGYKYWVLNGSARGYWAGFVTPQNLPQLLNLDLDLLLWIGKVGNHFYHRAVVQYEVPANKADDLDGFGRQFNSLGKWERLVGTDVETARRAFMPGGQKIPADWGHSLLSDYRTVFSTIAESIRPAGEEKGTLPLGKNGTPKGGTVFVSPISNPAIAVTGPSKLSGKSTTVAAWTLQQRPPIWIALTVTHGDRASDWALKFGGSVISLPLLDANEIMADEALTQGIQPNLDRDLVQARQAALMGDDARNAREFAHKQLNDWKKHGEALLPLVIQPEVVSVRYLGWVGVYLSTLLREDGIRDWFRRNGVHTQIVLDNFSHLGTVLRSGSSGILGDSPVIAANNIAQIIGEMVTNGANMGVWTTVISHDRADFDVIAPDFYRRFGLAIELGLDESHQFGRIVRPMDGEVVNPQLYINLPYRVREVLERQDGAEADVPAS